MFRRLYPTQDAESIYDINFAAYHEKGYRAVLFDIDNTLAEHGAPATQKVIDFFNTLHTMGYETCLISNNKEPRVASFAGQVDSRYLYKAGKPSPEGYRKAMKICGTTKENTLFVGDQLFTDVWGANRAGVYSILVKPIHPKEEIQIILKRRLEWIVLFFYRRYKKKHGKD
jgi:HAD superfamily phosphatase (TIGR01668 family)